MGKRLFALLPCILDKSNNVDILSPTMKACSTKLTEVAEVFHALSDETRLEILARLRNGEQCVCELTDSLKAAQSRLSFHLRVLKDAGLIKDRPEGRWMYYSLDEEAFEEVEEFLRSTKRVGTGTRSASQCC